MQKKALKQLKEKQAAALKQKRDGWKAGESAIPRMPAIKTKNSIKTLRGGAYLGLEVDLYSII